MNDMDKIEALCCQVARNRPEATPPPWFASRVMAHVRERAQAQLDSWFLSRVAWPLMAGGGALAASLAGWWHWINLSSNLGTWLMELSARPWLSY